MREQPTVAHCVLGLNIESDLPVPGLPITEFAPNIPDLHLHLGISPHTRGEIPSGPEVLRYTSTFLDETGEPALRIWSLAEGAYFRMAYSDGLNFWLDREGRRLWATWPDRSSLEHTVSYLLGPVLGVLLRYRGVTCLHASAVAVDDHAVAFVGAAGAGKSTTAAALAQRGYAVLSDDIAALEERDGSFYVNPAYPHLWLWPESVSLIYGSRDALPRPIPNCDKQRLSLASEGSQFAKRALPLGRIYILGERTTGAASYIEAVPMQTALMSLVANTYATYALDRGMRAKEFGLLGRLVSSVPVRRLHAQQDPPRLAELCDLLCEDFKVRAEDSPAGCMVVARAH